MSLSDFGWSILAGWLANKIDLGIDILIKKPSHENCVNKQQLLENNSSFVKKTKLFRVFDVYNDLEKILPYLADPIAHIIIEKEPTTWWNLACLVIESKLTGEWYVFERGRMAMQGTGGGIRQSKIAIERLREAKVFITPWVVPKSILDEFEDGIILWHEVKIKAVPLFSSIGAKEEDWLFIQEKTKKLLYNI
jgi:hypothetical protein